jgi:KUP system potassium uptake protein
MGDFRFVIFRRYLSNDNDLRPSEKLIMDAYFLLNRLAVSNQEYFGLDTSNVLVENVPLIIAPPQSYTLERDDSPFVRTTP